MSNDMSKNPMGGLTTLPASLVVHQRSASRGPAVRALFTPVAGLNDRRSQTGFLRAFLDAAVGRGQRVFHAEMGTGSGKTAAGLSAARGLFDLHRDQTAAGVPLARRRGARMAVAFTPSTGIQAGWVDETKRFQDVDPTADLKVYEPDTAGLIACAQTPDAVADRAVLLCSPHVLLHSEAARAALRDLIAAKDGEVVVIIDELHHYSKANTWGAAVAVATRAARYVIGLSGTPYRHDDGAILDAKSDERLVPDYVYSKAEALRDGVVARLVFQVVDAAIKDPKAAAAPLRLSEDEEARDGLRQAWQPQSPFLPTLLEDAMTSLAAVRERMGEVEPAHRPAGAIQCDSIQQLRRIRAILEARGARVLITHCRDGERPSEVISRFNRGDGDWLLAVKRLTEGLNIKRLRVGVYLSGITTRQTFEQFCGRFERLLDGVPPVEQDGLILVPHFPAFLRYAAEYEEAVKLADVRRRLATVNCASCGREGPANVGSCPHCSHVRPASGDLTGLFRGLREVPCDERTASALDSMVVVGSRRFSDIEMQDAARRFDQARPGLRSRQYRWIPDQIRALVQLQTEAQGIGGLMRAGVSPGL